MAVLSVRHFPDPILKAASRAVEHVTDETRQLVESLIDTMRHYPRCVGLAAPQVGVGLQVAVVDVTGHPKAGKGGGLVICINPEIVSAEASEMQREGCLSVPHLTGDVRRARRVEVRALDADGQAWRRVFEGFEAIAMQHEIDHLAGKLFLDRIENIRTGVFRRKRYMFPGEGGQR